MERYYSIPTAKAGEIALAVLPLMLGLVGLTQGYWVVGAILLTAGLALAALARWRWTEAHRPRHARAPSEAAPPE